MSFCSILDGTVFVVSLQLTANSDIVLVSACSASPDLSNLTSIRTLQWDFQKAPKSLFTFKLNQSAEEIFRVQEQDRLAMGSNPWLSIAKHTCS